MAALQVLCMDDDAWTGHVVTTVLGKRGHHVHHAHSIAEALHLAADTPPDVLITEAVLTPVAPSASAPSGDTGDGAALIQALRSQGGLEETAVVTLSALPVHDERVRAIGADGYLTKPFRFADLDLAVDRAVELHKRRQAGRLSPEPVADSVLHSGIHGSLDQLGLASLLTMIEMERKTGIVLLRRGSQSARLYCRDGRVVAARLFGESAPNSPLQFPVSSPSSGAEIVYQLLAWPVGYFNFTAMPVSVSDEIGLRTAHLLLEGARRNDEAKLPKSL
jgi:CheY-like chemotaxis protein